MRPHLLRSGVGAKLVFQIYGKMNEAKRIQNEGNWHEELLGHLSGLFRDACHVANGKLQFSAGSKCLDLAWDVFSALDSRSLKNAWVGIEIYIRVYVCSKAHAVPLQACS